VCRQIVADGGDHSDGDCPGGRFCSYVLRCAGWLGEGVDLSLRFRCPEAGMAARHAADETDWSFRPHRTRSRVGGGGRTYRYRPENRKWMAVEWPEEMDRECHLCRRNRHLGKRPGRWPSERLSGTEGYTRVRSGENQGKDGPADRAERTDHDDRLPRGRKRPLATCQHVQRYRKSAATYPCGRGLDGCGLRKGGLRKCTRLYPEA